MSDETPVSRVMTPIAVVAIVVIILILMAALDLYSTNVSFVKKELHSFLGITFPSFGDPYIIAYSVLSAIASALVIYVVFKIATAIKEAGGE